MFRNRTLSVVDASTDARWTARSIMDEMHHPDLQDTLLPNVKQMACVASPEVSKLFKYLWEAPIRLLLVVPQQQRATR